MLPTSTSSPLSRPTYFVVVMIIVNIVIRMIITVPVWTDCHGANVSVKLSASELSVAPVTGLGA